MRKNLTGILPWIAAVSLGLNIYLGGFVLLNANTATGGVNEESLLFQVKELQENIKKHEQENTLLKNKLQEIKEGYHINTSGGETYSWYFMRQKNGPPTTEPHYLQMLEDRGFYLGDTSKKQIYLTFDEGYENGYTSKILDVLKDNNVKSAFFVTGSYVRDNPELIKRMDKEGHIIGNHSNTHPGMPSLSDEKIKEELAAVREKVKSITGKEIKYFRPPRGEFNQRVLDLAKEEGYTTIFWSMAYQDWLTGDQPGEKAAYDAVVNNIHNGAIILLHAISESNAVALDRIIKDLKKEGYTFAGLDKLK